MKQEHLELKQTPKYTKGAASAMHGMHPGCIDRPLPATVEEIRQRGWQWVDVVLVTGDAYVDHPSFGVALIGRLLEAHGYRVAVLAQPRHDRIDDFLRFGPPRLFWGITAGNLDSIVANYSGNGKVRNEDQYSPGGNPYFGKLREKRFRRRPDRATIRYAQLARQAFAGVPVVLGGIEASLRRFVHFDYQQQKLRASVLTDAKADLLIYGMGERAVLETAQRLANGKDLSAIAGTCVRLADAELAALPPNSVQYLPSLAEIERDRSLFLHAELLIDSHARSRSSQFVAQRQQAMWLLQQPAASPLDAAEMDHLYALPFTRKPHPAAGDVPAYRMICHSITIVRGCFGNCSFCAIARHQGAHVTSRSADSVEAEASMLAQATDFTGVISDLGGPTANLYATQCRINGCPRRDCLADGICRHLRFDDGPLIDLLDRVAKVKGVRHLFVSSGLRMELLLATPRLLEKLLLHHSPGAMKIAPEHTVPHVLRLMHKKNSDLLPRFVAACREIGRRHRKKIALTPYCISSHPGCSVADMQALAEEMERLGLTVRQFQDFTPTPGTISTAMYVSGLDRDTRQPIHVPMGAAERARQRAQLEKRSGRTGRMVKRGGVK